MDLSKQFQVYLTLSVAVETGNVSEATIAGGYLERRTIPSDKSNPEPIFHRVAGSVGCREDASSPGPLPALQYT